MVTLSPRLATVARYVLPGEPFADIGTDHAYLPAYLVEQGAVPGAIAGDIMPGPLEAARATVMEAGLAGRIDLRLGSGLQVLNPGDAACAAICGMGGSLIADILAAGPLAGIRRLVLQPMGGEERLREWLTDNGFRLVAEELAEDAGRIYVIMAAEPGAMRLTEAEKVIGPFLINQRGPLLDRYAEIILGQLRRALEGARRSDRPEALERAADLARRIDMLEEVLANGARDGR